jgi:hypothetical protein
MTTVLKLHQMCVLHVSHLKCELCFDIQICNIVVIVVIRILMRKPEVKRSFDKPRRDRKTVLNCLNK